MLGNAELMSHIRYFTRAEAHHSESELLKYTGGEKSEVRQNSLDMARKTTYLVFKSKCQKITRKTEDKCI